MQCKDWREAHEVMVEANQFPSWPNEAMLKVLFGNYLKKKPDLSKKMKVLDVGCGFGNNLLPFARPGNELYGVEIDPKICEIGKNILRQKNIQANISYGHNRELNFEDNTFDLLVSINVLHYENSEENMLAALKEHHRVMKDGGALYLSTTGPMHEFSVLSDVVGPHLYKCKDYDFRNDNTFFFFDNEKYLQYYLSKFFNHVEVGRVTEQLMTRKLDYLVACCYK
jgi:ubiquinone/menaquinone biosynthesis C-methylase UbiE